MAEQRESIEAIKARYPIEEVAPRYTELRKVGAYLTGCCPFHNDRHPSFSVHLATATWRCYSACDAGGDVIDLVGYARFGSAWDSRDKQMFAAALGDLTGDGLPALRRPVPAAWQDRTGWQPLELTPRVQLLLDIAARTYRDELYAAGSGAGSPLAYLQQRGFTERTIYTEGIGYASGQRLAHVLAVLGFTRAQAAAVNLLDRARGWREFMRGRIVFCARDRRGRVLHLVGRRFAPALPVAAPKYLSLKAIGKPLHGYHLLSWRQSNRPVVVVESPPDEVTARQWGFDAVSTLGTGLKEEHAGALARLQRPKVFVPHNDGGAGLQAAQRWQARIGAGEILQLPDDCKDLNELALRPGGRQIFVERMRMHGYDPPRGRRAQARLGD